MPLPWNEIKSRAMAFAREWQDAAQERQQSIPFWIAFFDFFGLSNRREITFALADLHNDVRRQSANTMALGSSLRDGQRAQAAVRQKRSS